MHMLSGIAPHKTKPRRETLHRTPRVAVPHAAFIAAPETIDTVYGSERRRYIERRTHLLPDVVCAECLEARLPQMAQTEVLFSGWGMPPLCAEQLDRLPHLKAVFYAAGSCQGFARPLLERGILLTSAWRSNAIPVAEFTLAQILLSCKGYWRNVQEYDGTSTSHTNMPQAPHAAFRGPGNYGTTVALLGAGMIGRSLIALLRPFHVNVVVYDPYLSAEEATCLGVQKVELEDAFEQGFVVSNHLADKPDTAGLLNAALLSRLRHDATFINTGRGRTVNQPELIDVLRARPDLTVLLDVTDPEPMGPDSPLRCMPNVRVSSHIAGSIGDEVGRMADSAIAEFERYVRGEPLQHQVTLEMLQTMA